MSHPEESREFNKRMTRRQFLQTVAFSGVAMAGSVALLRQNVSTARAAPDMAATGPSLLVDVSADRHPISQDIYGINYYAVDEALAQELHIPVQRWGGDATTNYNWLEDSSNSGSDWFFMGGDGDSTPTQGASADAFINTAHSAGGKSILTIPMIGYVNETSEWNCSYPVSKYGPQQAVNPYVHPNGDDCGNGITPDGEQIRDTDPLYNYIKVGPDFMKQWIEHLIKVHGTADEGGAEIYQMDNEPFSWSNVHRDVHPQPTSYDELMDKTIAYARMVKDTDPSAKVLGPSPWGPPAYFSGNNDWTKPYQYGMPFVAWYLQQLNDYEQKNGIRLLDYFDLHDYPWGGEANTTAGDAAMQAMRLRSVRALWDPTYTTEDWMGQWFTPAKQLYLIPRMREWVKQNYPGTRISITEYNWGGLESINGALAQADILGVFGREQLDLATLWGPPKSDQPGAYAFRMYLSYDREGGRYGDVWVRSSSADQGQLAVYGAQRSSDGALTLMLINKTSSDLTSDLLLSGFVPGPNSEVYSYSEENLSAILRQPDQQVGLNGFTATYPANSITLIVVPTAASAVESLISTAEGMDSSDFSNAQRWKALINQLQAVLQKVTLGDYKGAANQLSHAILPKLDGCSVSGAPDSNDWVTSCAAQNALYPTLDALAGILRKAG